MKDKANEFTKLMVRISNIYNSVGNTMKETHRNIKYLGRITGKNSVSNKLIKTGIFCIASVPEPVISNTVGAALMATGAYIKKKKEVDLKELSKTLNKHIIELKKIREILHELKI